MPAGVSWPTYIRFCTAASISMFLGSQAVHNFYKPLEDLDELIQEEVKRLREEREKLQEKENNIKREKEKYSV